VLTQTPGKYEIIYSVWNAEPPEPNPHEFFYSQYITLACGFSLMFIAFCKFEGMNLFSWIKGKLSRKSSKSSTHEHDQFGDQSNDSDDDPMGEGYGQIPEGSIVAADR